MLITGVFKCLGRSLDLLVSFSSFAQSGMMQPECMTMRGKATGLVAKPQLYPKRQEPLNRSRWCQSHPPSAARKGFPPTLFWSENGRRNLESGRGRATRAFRIAARSRTTATTMELLVIV